MSPGLDQGAHAAQLAAMLAPYQDEEDDVRRGYSDLAIDEEVENAEDFASLRAEQLIEYLTEEGRLGSGVDPCPPPPDPEGPGGGSSGGSSLTTPPPPPLPGLQLRRARVVGSQVVTRLWVPGPGQVRKVVTARLGKRRKGVCSASERAPAMGPVTLRCRLSPAALRHLEQRSLSLSIAVSFKPTDADPQTRTRSLVAKPR